MNGDKSVYMPTYPHNYEDTPSASSDNTDCYENDVSVGNPDPQFDEIRKLSDSVIYVNVV